MGCVWGGRGGEESERGKCVLMIRAKGAGESAAKDREDNRQGADRKARSPDIRLQHWAASQVPLAQK